MKQREVQDAEQLIWMCVQAFSGVGGQVAMKAAELAERADGTVAVVCTPRGGAQSVRIELGADWAEQLSDAELLTAIAAGAHGDG